MPTDPATLGYLAGLLDGEGCIVRTNGRWRIQIAMTDEAVISWLGTFGGTVKERKVTGDRKRCWIWLAMRQVDVRLWLLAVLPYVRIKRDRAIQAIAEIEIEGIGWDERLLALEQAGEPLF